MRNVSRQTGAATAVCRALLCALLFVMLAAGWHAAWAADGNATFRAAVGQNGSAEGVAVRPESGASPVAKESANGAAIGADGSGNASSLAEPVKSSTPQAEKELPLPSSGWGNYFQAVGVLLLILGGLYLGIWALKRFGKLHALGGRLSRHGVAVEGQFHLGPKKSLVVVRFLNKRLLLGVTDHQINLLTEMEAEHDPTNESRAADFKAILEDADRQDTSS
ncbi:flagellar biosynthetic protein FliO [Desulfovibrio mangrovi]|uniref:flagellar biosynthetic protein FliO n=1 Tax=Desulfovibrio mangrovi TaxID=2976983 RepID=UPI002245B193|nr:flagellar biosynthetic protein FliO [Desulfovibrio mangrovi]UZP66228.1 flagellar biosynthetic protein FliO [Desulfovibrio mangrovi]